MGGGCSAEVNKGEKWDNCNSIINKIYLKKQIGIQKNFLNIMKATYETPTINITLKGKKDKKLSSKIKNKTRMPIFTPST